jgi:DNA-binding NtrC family response regulator
MKAEKDPINMKTAILLVDDDANFRFSMATELRAGGYLVQGAENGERAIRMLQGNSSSKAGINLVITDLVMPRKDGLKFCQEMKSMGKDLKVLVISGYMDLEIRRELENLGYNEFLEKPFSSIDLMEKVETLLGSEAVLRERTM